jgi:hypothetical protein
MSLISFAVGLILGWNFIPQPKFVSDMVSSLVEKYIKK